jgi:acylglycerol lipase
VDCRQVPITRDAGLAAIPCYEWRPPVSPTTTIIAVHGLGDHGRALPYQRLAEALVPRGHRVISYDQREHGGDQRRLGERARLPGLVQDLCTVAQHVRRDSPGTPLVAIGLSMGALVTILACTEQPDLVDGVVAASAPLDPVSAGRMTILAATVLGPVLPGLSLDTGIDVSAVTDNNEDLAAYAGDPHFRTRIRLGLAADLLGATKTLVHRAATLQVPTLFLHGRHDRIAPWGPHVAARLQGGTRVVRVFERGHHNLFLDHGRAEVFREIAQWVSAFTPRRS